MYIEGFYPDFSLEYRVCHFHWTVQTLSDLRLYRSQKTSDSHVAVTQLLGFKKAFFHTYPAWSSITDAGLIVLEGAKDHFEV